MSSVNEEEWVECERVNDVEWVSSECVAEWVRVYIYVLYNVRDDTVQVYIIAASGARSLLS